MNRLPCRPVLTPGLTEGLCILLGRALYIGAYPAA